MNVAKGVWLWGPVALYTRLIFWLSSCYRPVPGMQYFVQMDKVAHLLEYLPYGWLMSRALRQSFPRFSSAWVWGVAFVLVVGVATLDEYVQSFVPLKNSSLADGLFDALGALLGLSFYRWRSTQTP